MAGVQSVLLYAGGCGGQAEASTGPVPHQSIWGRVRQVRGGCGISVVG